LNIIGKMKLIPNTKLLQVLLHQLMLIY